MLGFECWFGDLAPDSVLKGKARRCGVQRGTVMHSQQLESLSKQTAAF